MSQENMNRHSRIVTETFLAKWKLRRYDEIRDLYFGASGNRNLLHIAKQIIADIEGGIKVEDANTILNRIKKIYNIEDGTVIEGLYYYWKIPMHPHHRIAVSLLRTEVPRHNEEQFIHIDAVTSEPEIIISLSDYFMTHLIWLSRKMYRFQSKHNVYGIQYFETYEWGNNVELESAIVIKAKEMIEFAEKIAGALKCNAQKVDSYYVIPNGIDIV